MKKVKEEVQETKLNLQDFINPSINTNQDLIDQNSIISLLAVQNLLSPQNNKTNSRIKFSQVSELTKLYLFADIFKVGVVKKLADNILDLQISINGLGRKELVELVNQVNNGYNEPNVKVTRKDIFK